MLPGLMPVHTRRSFHSSRRPESTGSRLPIEKHIDTPDEFILSPETGLWLLPVHFAETDAQKDIVRADFLATELERQGSTEENRLRFLKIARLIGRSSINELGCLHGGLRGKQTPAELVIKLSEFEVMAGADTTEDEVPYISVCGNDDCYNARHHAVDFGGTAQNTQRVDLNPNWYSELADGRIRTIWGDVLPTVEESLRYFIEFQRLNYPFTPFKESILTPTPISQISFHPVTGCWEAYIYERNTPNLANIKNGYGIMYARQEGDQVDPYTGEITKGYRRGSVLAHNLIWVASGNYLDKKLERNHLCNYTRCCNPLHIEQITPDENRRHGHSARAVIRALEAEDPSKKDALLSLAEIAELNISLRELYLKIESSIV